MIIMQVQENKEDELEVLTRNSDIYNKAIEQRIINDSDSNSTINSIHFQRLSMNCEWISHWSSLSEEGTITNISQGRYKNLLSLSPSERSDRIHNNSSHTWTIKDKNLSLNFNITVKAEFESKDGLTFGGKCHVIIEDYDDVETKLSKLASASENEEININIIDDNYFNVEIRGTTYKFKKCDLEYDNYTDEFSQINPEAKNKDYLEQLITYVNSDKRWVKSKIGELKFKDDKIYVPVIISESSVVHFPFKPEEKDSEIWNLLDQFSYDDPLLLEGEEVYISFNNSNRKNYGNSIINNVMWELNKDNLNNSQNVLKYKLKSTYYIIKSRL